MINFLYKYSLISICSFILSNLLFYFLDKIFHPSIASLITIIIMFNFNIFIFFKTNLLTKSKKNYYKLLAISFGFRVFEYLFFNFLYLFVFVNIKSNYIFILSLIVSIFLKTIIYYRISANDKRLKAYKIITKKND